MRAATRILVTGSGGFAGVNFVRALRASKRRYFIVGTDFNRYHIAFPDVDKRYLTPRHSDRKFIEEVSKIVRKERIGFVHPQPSSEALVLSGARRRLAAKVFLPPADVMRLGQDKFHSQQVLSKMKVPVAKTRALTRLNEIASAFRDLGGPLWARARHGAGGRLSLLCSTANEAHLWIELWEERGVPVEEFILQEYLPGRNVAWDSIWKAGRLVTSYARERLEYPFKHIAPSGITGTPSVARIIHDENVNHVARRSVLAIDKKPNGAYSVDLKESSNDEICVTEVDCGKFHSTMPLWGYVAVKHLGLPWYANMADLYLRLGTGERVRDRIPRANLMPDGYYLLRDIDVGAYLWKEDGWKEKVL